MSIGGTAVIVGGLVGVGAGVAGVVSAVSSEKNDARNSAIAAGTLAATGLTFATIFGIAATRQDELGKVILGLTALSAAAGGVGTATGAGLVSLMQRQ